MYDKANALGREADAAKSDDLRLSLYLQAWDAAPEPRSAWDGGTWIWNGVASIYMNRRDYTKALEAARNAEASYRGVNNGTTMMMLGSILLEGFGDREGAAGYFRRASDMSEGRALRGMPREYRELAAGNLGVGSAGSYPSERLQGSRDDDSEKITPKVHALFEAGERLIDREKPDKALEKFESALALLPAPIEAWEEFTMITAAIGDVYAAKEMWERASEAFRHAVMGPGGVENPFLHLRLGQCALALGQHDTALEELLQAFMLEGEAIFDDDPESYAFLKSRVALGA
jgi:tetratricopeptide (TPR) repeat protein